MQADPLTLEGLYENLADQSTKMYRDIYEREPTLYTHDRGTSIKFGNSLHFRGESELAKGYLLIDHSKQTSMAGNL